MKTRKDCCKDEEIFFIHFHSKAINLLSLSLVVEILRREKVVEWNEQQQKRKRASKKLWKVVKMILTFITCIKSFFNEGKKWRTKIE